MNVRNLSIIVAVLVALCAVVWFVQRPGPPAAADPRVGQPLLPADAATQATRVKFSDHSQAVDLVRAADGSWTVASYFDFPADLAKLKTLVTELTEARIQRLVTARADRLARLEFKDTSIDLRGAGDRELWQLTLGKTADRGGRYVRFGTEEKGYLADKAPWLDAESKNWADPSLLNLKPEEIARIEISFPNAAPLIVSRGKKEDPWTPAAPTAVPAGKRLKTDRITALLPNLTSVRFTETTKPDDQQAVAAQAHARTVKLTTFDQKTYTITLARQPEEKKAKPVEPGKEAPGGANQSAKSAEEKPKEPEFETIPAGPVFVRIQASDDNAPVNGLMKKRAFETGEWAYTGLPASPEECWEPVPEAPSAAKPEPGPKG